VVTNRGVGERGSGADGKSQGGRKKVVAVAWKVERYQKFRMAERIRWKGAMGWIWRWCMGRCIWWVSETGWCLFVDEVARGGGGEGAKFPGEVQEERSLGELSFVDSVMDPSLEVYKSSRIGSSNVRR